MPNMAARIVSVFAKKPATLRRTLGKNAKRLLAK
jgi:hypothetical protein